MSRHSLFITRYNIPWLRDVKGGVNKNIWRRRNEVANNGRIRESEGSQFVEDSLPNTIGVSNAYSIPCQSMQYVW